MLGKIGDFKGEGEGCLRGGVVGTGGAFAGIVRLKLSGGDFLGRAIVLISREVAALHVFIQGGLEGDFEVDVPWRRGRDFESIRGVLKIERFISEFDRENFEVDGVEFNYIGVGFAADVHVAFDKVAGAVDFEIEVVMLGGEIFKKYFNVYIIYQI